MKLSHSIATLAICVVTQHAFAQPIPGDVAAGRNLFLLSCAPCHVENGAQDPADTAPPLSFMARESKDRPDYVRGRLMNPHSPMPGFMLSRQQIDDVIAYLRSVSSQ